MIDFLIILLVGVPSFFLIFAILGSADEEGGCAAFFAIIGSIWAISTVYDIKADFEYEQQLDEVSRYNENQYISWYNDSAGFLSDYYQNKENADQKINNKVREISPPLIAAINLVEDQIKESEFKLFALRDELIRHYSLPEINKWNSRTVSLVRQNGLYSQTSIGLKSVAETGLIEEVVFGGPADRLDINVGDKITEMWTYGAMQPITPPKYQKSLQSEVNVTYPPTSIGHLRTFTIQPKKPIYLPFFGIAGLYERMSSGAYGYRIEEFPQGSAAKKAGVKKGDILVAINDKKFINYNSFEIHRRNMQQGISEITLRRDGEEIKLNVSPVFELMEEYTITIAIEHIATVNDEILIEAVRKISSLEEFSLHLLSQRDKLFRLDALKKISEDDSIDTEFYNLVQQTNISVDRIEEVFEIN